MKNYRNRAQVFFRLMTAGFLVVTVFGLYSYQSAEAQSGSLFSVQDGMGTTYDFNVNNNNARYTVTAYSGYSENGSIHIKGSNIIAEAGDNVAFPVYVDGSQLKTMALSIIPHPMSTVGQGLTLDTGIDSIAANQVNIFDVRRYGIYVSWVKNGEQYYAIIDRWHGIRYTGDVDDAARNGIILPPIGAAEIVGDNGGDVTGSISGDSYVLVLDSSGSMSGAKIETAKNQIKRFVNKLSADDEVALFIFEGCGDVQLVQGYTQDKSKIINSLAAATAQGGSSPVAESIQVGRNYLENYHHGQKGELKLYSDGGENCQGDPIAAAAAVRASTFGIDFGIVGYNLSRESKKELKAIAKAGGGKLDKEIVLDPEKEKRNTAQTKNQAAASAAAGLAGAVASYAASGGSRIGQMWQNVFGGNGLIGGLRSPAGTAPATGTLAGQAPPAVVSQADLRHIRRLQNSLADFKRRLSKAVKDNDLKEAERMGKNISSYAKELSVLQKNAGQKQHVNLSMKEVLKTDQGLYDAAKDNLQKFADQNERVATTRENFINNTGRAMVKFIDSFRDPMNPYHVIPHKDVNTFRGMIDDANKLGDQIHRYRDEVQDQISYYDQYENNWQEYVDRKPIRDQVKEITDQFEDLENKINE